MGIETLDQLYELFYIATYGCNRRLEAEVKTSLEKQGQPSNFVFHEYFFHQPLCEAMDIAQNGYLLAPFAIRMIEKSLLIPDVKEKDGKWEIKYVTRKADYCIGTKIKLLNMSSWLTLAAFHRWKKKEYTSDTNSLVAKLSGNEKRTYKSALLKETILGLAYYVPNGSSSHREGFGLLSKFKPAIFKKVADAPFKNEVTKRSRRLHYGFMRLIYPDESKDTNFFSLFVPIASSHIFYGGVWFQFPVEYKADHENIFKNIGLEILKAINEIYVPALALLHNHFCEKMANEGALDDFSLSDGNDSKCHYNNVFLKLGSPDFHMNEFKGGYTLDALFHALEEHNLPITGNTITKLNQLLKITDLYDQIVKTIAKKHPLKDLKKLEEAYSYIKAKAEDDLERRNRLLLEEFFPHVTPKTEKFSEPIEKGIVKLWRKRQTMMNTRLLSEEHFIFREYLVCSKGMVDLTRKVIEDAESIKVDDKSLPSTLVIGSAGSGKDTFAKMSGIFSKSFCAGERHTLNMASLKPAPLVSGMVMGVNAEIGMPAAGGAYNTYNLNLKGILQKIRQKTIKSAAAEAQPVNLDEYNKYPTLVLDELNSMDIDSQGVLLRFLENAEMIPLGAIEDLGLEDDTLKKSFPNDKDHKKLNCCLVIGVMNEDPDELSREKAMDFINDRSYLGGLLGDFLYEHFAKMRRLRPDIKYRMSRHGKYKLPMLKDRKEDIPLLFFIYCDKELKALCDRKISLHVTLEAFDRLMSDTLLWRGNIRELQALAKRVVARALKNGDSPDNCIITNRHVNQGLKDLYLIVEDIITGAAN